ncbi:hypothetical protein HMPREF3213_03583 [Heyndrickxia coagulans]|jgi:hypothetical protein|uniref:Uncharacterized protein n=1 Tax=Heyndrickxia coagulans TaxID=1398 RepID=A0A133KBG5_HEYCO|nr:hypothetical protein HMPREF3213_03583 [Heyndrickxia coagulans]
MSVKTAGPTGNSILKKKIKQMALRHRNAIYVRKFSGKKNGVCVCRLPISPEAWDFLPLHILKHKNVVK